MAKETEPMIPTAREALAQLIEIRRSWPRDKAAPAIGAIASAFGPYAQTLLADAGGAEHARAEAARAVMALAEAYKDRGKLVHDGIWAAAVNAAYRWRDAEGA